MKFPDYLTQEIEPAILQFWQKQKIVEKLRKRNKNGKKFYFLEGPPYTSGRIHLGHAWNMALKDIVLRQRRMQGLAVWDRMGYDMHGLPTEQKTMKKLGLKNKEEITVFGVKKFAEECRKFCIEMMEKMNEDFFRLGTTLDMTKPYQPISMEFMEAEWWLIKQAHQKSRLYQGLRTMHWDFATQTAVAKHELEYKQVTDTAIFVKFQHAKDNQKYFVIWTTTPWTIPLNLAIMVNPALDYVEVAVDNETWIVGQSLLETVMEKAGVKKYKVTKKYKGKALAGQAYSHPLDIKQFLPKELQQNPKLFTVLLTEEYVDDSAGTGLVHSAPGCGPEDYEVGHQNGIPPFNCVDEEGLFQNFGPFNGWRAKLDDKNFITALDDAGAIVAKEPYVHEYPHGERSHEPVIFRTTKQWFFKVEDLKEKMIRANEKIYWNPESAKNAFRSWLENLRDNSITKQRYWGTPVPIWQAEDGDFLVVGSVAELERLSGKRVREMHIPAIDEITLTKDGKLYTRIPDVLDVWIDAGTTSWNCLDYPRNKELFEQLFPADFILEGKDQIRGWFNLLMVSSFLAFDKPSFKNVYMNGFVTDVSGVKMSKSLGNIISPYEVIDKHGADVLRYYMCQTSAGEDINFSWAECQVKERQLHILWNIHKLLINLAKEHQINPFQLKPKSFDIEEKYILSRLHSTLKKVTAYLDCYQLDNIIMPIEEFFLDLSRTYIQIVRDKSSLGTVEEKKCCVFVIGHALLETLKMLSLIAPFISEAMYLNLKEEFSLAEESISHYTWPQADEKQIDEELEQAMNNAQEIIQAALHAREKARLGLRWPIKEVIVESDEQKVRQAVDSMREIILTKTNAKEIKVVKTLPGVKYESDPDKGAIGKQYGPLSPKILAELATKSPDEIKVKKGGVYQFTIDGEKIEITKDMLRIKKELPEHYEESETKFGSVYINTQRTEELDAEGFAREVMRVVQSLRKEAGLEKPDRIALHVQSSDGMVKMLAAWQESIREKVGATKIEFSSEASSKKFAHNKDFTVKQETFVVKFDKV